MNSWTLNVIMTKGFPVKVYVNAANTQAYIFPLFGRYFGLSSDSNVIDFATDFLIGNCNPVVITHANYVNSLEDTAVIQLDTIHAA
jgi:hypothetical protein